jgi:hypothetical protein
MGTVNRQIYPAGTAIAAHHTNLIRPEFPQDSGLEQVLELLVGKSGGLNNGSKSVGVQ